MSSEPNNQIEHACSCSGPIQPSKHCVAHHPHYAPYRAFVQTFYDTNHRFPTEAEVNYWTASSPIVYQYPSE